MADHVRGTSMTPFVFPSAVTILVFVSWVALAAVETCTPQNIDPMFDCWTSLQLAAMVAGIGSALAGLMALLARVVLYRTLPFVTRRPELISALLSSVVLGILFTSVGPWIFKLESIGIQFLCWLGASLVICGLSLLVVKHWMMRGTR